jgi:hypothetical protein
MPCTGGIPAGGTAGNTLTIHNDICCDAGCARTSGSDPLLIRSETRKVKGDTVPAGISSGFLVSCVTPGNHLPTGESAVVGGGTGR